MKWFPNLLHLKLKFIDCPLSNATDRIVHTVFSTEAIFFSLFTGYNGVQTMPGGMFKCYMFGSTLLYFCQVSRTRLLLLGITTDLQGYPDKLIQCYGTRAYSFKRGIL